MMFGFFSADAGQAGCHKDFRYKDSIMISCMGRRIFLLALLLQAALVLFFSAGCAKAESSPLQLVSLHATGDRSRVRIIAVFNRKPDYDVMLLGRPARLVINLPATEFPQQQARPPDFLQDMRYGMISHDRSRMLFISKFPFRLEHITTEPLQDHIWQMVIDLARSSDVAFETALRARLSQRKNGAADRNGTKPQPFLMRPFNVVIDAGHGDFDSGARGVSGMLEKEVTLAFARVLRDTLQKNPGINVCLTRDEDKFLRLNERVAIARSCKADLFLSIHADHIAIDSWRGATVYTLSDKASDKEAGMLAEHENRADLLDGLPPDESPEVMDILLDLARRETQAFSIDFANRVVDTLEKSEFNLNKNPHRYAGFQVLRAAEIPSVLVELGYLSNAEDEKLISDPLWRGKMAERIAGVIRDYADIHRRQPARR